MFSVTVSIDWETEKNKQILQIEQKRNSTQISTGLMMTSWLFTRCEEVELVPANTNPFSRREEDLTEIKTSKSQIQCP